MQGSQTPFGPRFLFIRAGDISYPGSIAFLDAGPVFDTKSRHACHVTDVRGYQRRVGCERVRRDRGVEVLNPITASFQRRPDAAVRLTHGIGPFSAADL